MARVEEHIVLYLPEETKRVYYNPNTWFWENSSINLMNVLNVRAMRINLNFISEGEKQY